MGQSIDYRRLGEVSGKAWRLGHLEVGYSETMKQIEATKASLKVPRSEWKTFRLGFWAGINAIDKERGKAKQ